jgi:hypothetical protein
MVRIEERRVAYRDWVDKLMGKMPLGTLEA